MAEINTQIASLATNLQRVQSQGGQFVDDQGELVGAALRNSFKGKVVKMLVDRGIAREGNLGGRVAVALVGQENFDRLRTSAQELSSTSVCNVLRLLERLESEGLDSDLKSEVTSTLYSKISGSTPISELNEAALQTLHRTIQDEVIPQRRAYRQELLAAVNAGHPTPAMRNASQAALLVAGRSLEEKLDQAPDPGKLAKKLDQLLQEDTFAITTGQGRSIPQGVLPILHEYKAVSTHLKSGLEGEIRQLERQITEAGAQTDPTQVAGQELQLSQRKRELSQVDDTLRQRFIGALQQTYATNDVEDGMHVRQDGSAVRVKSKSKPKSEGIDEYLTLGGVREGEVPSVATGQWALDIYQALDDAKASGNKEDILIQAKRLNDIIGSPLYSAEEKTRAHMVKQAVPFHNDYDCVKEVLGAGKRWEFDEEITGIYRPNAEQFKDVIENKIRELDALIANPESHPDYEVYQDVFSDLRVGRHFGPGREVLQNRLRELNADPESNRKLDPNESETFFREPGDGRTQIIREAKEERARAQRLLERHPVFRT